VDFANLNCSLPVLILFCIICWIIISLSTELSFEGPEFVVSNNIQNDVLKVMLCFRILQMTVETESNIECMYMHFRLVCWILHLHQSESCHFVFRCILLMEFGVTL
jgi:hypothetical protein